jgi:hypothetical protein
MCYEERYYSEWVDRRKREKAKPAVEPRPEVKRDPEPQPAQPREVEPEVEVD